MALLLPTNAVAHGRELELDSICGTPEPSEQDIWAFAKVVRTHAAKINADPNRRELAQSFSAVVPTVYHIIMNSTNAGVVQDRIIQLQHTAINAGFAGTGFSFQHVATIRTVNDTWYDVFPFTPEENEMKMALHQGGFETLNVYIRGLPFGLLGYASLITVSPEIFTEPSLDGIVLSNDALPESVAYAEFGYDQGDSLVHETGHWLNLYHTFEGGCNSAWGDFADDTRKWLTSKLCICQSSRKLTTTLYLFSILSYSRHGRWRRLSRSGTRFMPRFGGPGSHPQLHELLQRQLSG